MINVLRNVFFRDFWLKLFSLVLATLIWLIVYLFAIKQDVAPSAALRNANVKEHSLPGVPVLVVSSAADVHDFRVNPSSVTVKVRGDRKDIDALKSPDIHAIVDLTGIESATDLTKKISVTVPSNITFISAEPDSVEVIVPPKP